MTTKLRKILSFTKIFYLYAKIKMLEINRYNLYFNYYVIWHKGMVRKVFLSNCARKQFKVVNFTYVWVCNLFYVITVLLWANISGTPICCFILPNYSSDIRVYRCYPKINIKSMCTDTAKLQLWEGLRHYLFIQKCRHCFLFLNNP